MVIALWTDHLAEHEAAIREVLGADSIVTMRQVRYSETFLRTLQDEVFADREWMEAIPAHMTGVGTDITENAVIINVSSAVHDAAEQIAGHFAQGDALRVVSDGTGEVFIPSGLVKGKVVTADGGPIGARRLWLDESVTLRAGVAAGTWAMVSVPTVGSNIPARSATGRSSFTRTTPLATDPMRSDAPR